MPGPPASAPTTQHERPISNNNNNQAGPRRVTPSGEMVRDSIAADSTPTSEVVTTPGPPQCGPSELETGQLLIAGSAASCDPAAAVGPALAPNLSTWVRGTAEPAKLSPLRVDRFLTLAEARLSPTTPGNWADCSYGDRPWMQSYLQSTIDSRLDAQVATGSGAGRNALQESISQSFRDGDLISAYHLFMSAARNAATATSTSGANGSHRYDCSPS